MSEAMKQAARTKILRVHSIGLEMLREAIRLGFTVIIVR